MNVETDGISTFGDESCHPLTCEHTMAQKETKFIPFATPKIKACTNCRRRKVKCDEQRPKCGPCSRSLAFQDCEYDDAGPSRIQMLEEQISILEARIHELENPSSPSDTVFLRNPFTRSQEESPASSHEQSMVSIQNPSEATGFGSAALDLSLSNVSNSALIPVAELGRLMHSFLYHHSSHFGLFLNVQSLEESLMGRTEPRPTAALIDVVALLAISLSDSGPEFTSIYESIYLSRALRTSVEALSPGAHQQHRNSIIHAIQAEVLLSYYFLKNSRILEAKYHISAAVSLVLCSHLHRLGSAHSDVDPPSTVNLLGAPSSTVSLLPPAQNSIEQNERINAFWTVLTLSCCWTTADGSPPNMLLAGGNGGAGMNARVDTPWPADFNESGDTEGVGSRMPPGNGETNTITAFLDGMEENDGNGLSLRALHSKAAILFEQAALVAERKREDSLLEKFKSTSLHAILTNNSVEGPRAREILVIHTLTHVATMQLHNPFIMEYHRSRLRVLDSARAVVGFLERLNLDRDEFSVVDPIMGTLLMATGQVLITELSLLRINNALSVSSLGDVANLQQEQSLIEAIETILKAMKRFAVKCVLIESQLTAMQELYRQV
ncbi:fungal-trans domain-containing protein [Favolaschia claudopus]|uniref:Fungal-trans domain-containing protein n=1 Tax=Favolaschia claudopus TaxID=2862362 RepID=A0AAW0BHC4_9AGAR